MLKNKPFWFTIALIAAYLLAAYIAVPPWLQPRLEQYVHLHLGRQLHFEKLLFDPLTWSADLTGVRLTPVEQAVSGEHELFPDTELTADSVHLRFNFWRLHAAVSALVLKAPVLTIDGSSMLMQSGHYPFVTQWQQWSLAVSNDPEHQPVPVRRWRLDAGRVLLTSKSTQESGELILDDLLMQAGKVDAGGQREYALAFLTKDGSAITLQGQLDGSALESSGRYQWAATLPQNVQSAGEFSISAKSDFLLIELANSQLSSDQLERCALNGLLCARIYPLNLSFSATLQASMVGARLLSAQGQQAAFEMDASLAQGAVTVYQQLAIESTDLQVRALPEPLDRAGLNLRAGDLLEFDLALQAADNQQFTLQGQFHPESEHAGMRFTSLGEREFTGDLQWQWIAAQQAEAAYPQMELRLENPAASLASDFIAEHLSDQVDAAALQWQLTAKLKDQELRFDESIRLEQVNASPNQVLPHVVPNVQADVQVDDLTNVSTSAPQSGQAGASTLDVAWLLALLQNPQSNLELEIPEQAILLTEQQSLQTLVQAPILTYLEQVSAQPFEGLALQMGKEGQNLAEVQFESGSAELSASSSESLMALAEALVQRPGLGLELAGVYDPLIDKKALQIEQIRTHIGLATAAELAFQSGSEPPDFNDPQVHSVIDEFARQRLPAEVLKAFAEHFGEADVDRGVIPEGDIAAYYSALFELLVDYADIEPGALITLARYRVQAVVELLTGQGVSRDRLHAAAEPRSSEAKLTGVPLQLQLTIHSGKNPELLEDSSSGEMHY